MRETEMARGKQGCVGATLDLMGAQVPGGDVLRT